MKPVTYKTSGVDIDKANDFVRAIKGNVAATKSAAVLERKGAFASLVAMDGSIKKPVLVSSTDGVGTKLLIAQRLNQHDTVGIDLVAMNVNDILCVGAQPLFFLDYIACGRLDPKILKDVVKGIAKGCRQAGCSLVGGETAEMPGMYKPTEYDLAGFACGVIGQKNIIDGSNIKAGDKVIGLPSSGIHSNGYSLVRKVLTLRQQRELADDILKPTKIYVKDVMPVLERFKVKGMAHITGGAYYEKLTKVLPDGLCFSIDRTSWKVPKIFPILQKQGKISDSEMFKTFNMGIGFVLVVGKNVCSDVEALLRKRKVRHYLIGDVIRHKSKKVVFR